MNRMLRCNILIQQALEHTMKRYHGIYTHTYTCNKKKTLILASCTHHEVTIIALLFHILAYFVSRQRQIIKVPGWFLKLNSGQWQTNRMCLIFQHPSGSRLILFPPLHSLALPPTVIMLHIITLILYSNAPASAKCIAFS